MWYHVSYYIISSIEGNPFITRFKTPTEYGDLEITINLCIEGNPFITRFKTAIAGELACFAISY